MSPSSPEGTIFVVFATMLQSVIDGSEGYCAVCPERSGADGKEQCCGMYCAVEWEANDVSRMVRWETLRFGFRMRWCRCYAL